MTFVMGQSVTFAASQTPHLLTKLETSKRKENLCSIPSNLFNKTQKTMKFNLKTISLASLAALALIAAPAMQSAHAEGGRGRHFEQLNLTEAQTEQIEAIRESSRAQRDAVLTNEQQAILENSETGGRRAFRQLDLSEDQREQLRAIRESSREQIGEVLTAEQREQLEEMHSQRRGRRGEGR